MRSNGKQVGTSTSDLKTSIEMSEIEPNYFRFLPLRVTGLGIGTLYVSDLSSLGICVPVFGAESADLVLGMLVRVGALVPGFEFEFEFGVVPVLA